MSVKCIFWQIFNEIVENQGNNRKSRKQKRNLIETKTKYEEKKEKKNRIF